jgi:hypothetical protein
MLCFTPLQKNCLYFFNHIESCGLKKVTTTIPSDDGIKNLYVPDDTIRGSYVRFDGSFDEWVKKTAAQNHEILENFNLFDEESMQVFKKQVAFKIPQLVRKRTLFSFRNGKYDADTGSFTTDEVFDVPQNHFDFDFDEKLLDLQSWIDIQTPSMDKLLKGQDFSEKETEWMWVLLGRLLYPLETHDYWNCIMYLNDAEQSKAKEDIVSLIAYIFGEGVVQLPGHSFDSDDICDARVFVVNNLVRNMSHQDRSTMIQWVSGDDTLLSSMASYRVVVPGVLCGDGDFDLKMTTKPDEPFLDRLVKFNLKNAGDESVLESLKREIASIIVKANTAYRQRAAVNPGNRWKAMEA